MTRSIIAFAVWLLCICSLPAGERVRGGLTLHEVNGQLNLRELGEDVINLSVGQVPITTMGLIECEASYGSSVFMKASNRSAIYFEGSGSFAVERFEQIRPELAAWNADTLEASQSRVILNFRGGDLIVDNRKMLDSSQFLVETPLGLLTIKRALWQMRIVFDPRSQIFDFTTTCTEGSVRFIDLQGQQYRLYTGQRLAGAGSPMSPSIEVGEKTERSRGQMQRYHDLASQHAAATNDFTQYLVYLQVIEQNARSTPVLPLTSRPNSTRRPLVIEYAKEPEPVTPFRGEVKPPSAYQADLF